MAIRGGPRAGAPWLRNLREQIAAIDIGGGLPSLAKNPIKMTPPVAKQPIKMIPPAAKNPVEMGRPNMQWWANDGYNSIQEAIKSGNYTFKMGEGFVKNPNAVTPAMEEAAAVETATVTDMETGLPSQPPPAYEPPVSAVLENIGTSATAEVVDPVTEVVDPVTEAVETAVGGGATTTAPPVEEKPIVPIPNASPIAPTMAPPEIEQIEQAIAQLPPEIIPQVIPQLPPEIIPQVIPQLPPEIIPQVIPQLPPEVIPQVIPQLPPEVIAQVIPQLPPEVIQQLPPEIVADPVTTAVNAAVGGGSTATAPPPATMGASSSADLGTLGTSGVATMDSPPVQMSGQTITLPGGGTVVIPSQEEIMATIAKMGGEPEVVQETAQTETLIDPVTAAVNQATGNTQEKVGLPYDGEPQVTVDVPQTETLIDPVTSAVDAAVGGGQSTTDENILDTDDMIIGGALVTPYYNPLTGETFDQTNTAMPVPEGFIPVPEGGVPTTSVSAPVGEQEPDFMTQLQELIAQMQGEQTTAAEAQAAAQAAEQQKMNEMSQNYVVGGSAMGYNPYMSGQYQSNPYGPAGAPDMGGITSIPVPAPLQNFTPPQDQPTAMEMFNAGYQSPRTTKST